MVCVPQKGAFNPVLVIQRDVDVLGEKYLPCSIVL